MLVTKRALSLVVIMNFKFFVLFIAISHFIISMELPPQEGPSLFQLAFNATIPQINKEIESITDKKHCFAKDKLVQLNALMTQKPFLDDFALEHGKVKELLKCVADQHYKMIEKEDLVLFKDKTLQPTLEQCINGYILKNFAEDYYTQLPDFAGCHVRALCFVGDKMVCASLSNVLDILEIPSSIRLLDIRIEAAEKVALVKLNTLLEQKISEATEQKNILINTFSLSKEDIYNSYNSKSCFSENIINPESYNYLNGFDICFSRNKKCMAKQYELNGIKNIRLYNTETKESSGTQISGKMCFSFDSTLLFLTTNTDCYAINCENHGVQWQYSMNDTKALCSLSGQEALMITCPKEGGCFELWSANQEGTMCLYRKDLDLDPSVAITAASFSNNGQIIALGCSDGSIVLVNRGSKEIISTLFDKECNYEGDIINKIVFCPQDTMVFTNISTKAVQIWDIGTGKCIKTFGLQRTYDLEVTGKSYDLSSPSSPSLDKIYKCAREMTVDIPLLIFNVPCDKDDEIAKKILDGMKCDWSKKFNLFEIIKEQVEKRKQKPLYHEREKRSEQERKWQEKLKAQMSAFNRFVLAVPVMICGLTLFVYCLKYNLLFFS